MFMKYRADLVWYSHIYPSMYKKREEWSACRSTGQSVVSYNLIAVFFCAFRLAYSLTNWNGQVGSFFFFFLLSLGRLFGEKDRRSSTPDLIIHLTKIKGFCGDALGDIC